MKKIVLALFMLGNVFNSQSQIIIRTIGFSHHFPVLDVGFYLTLAVDAENGTPEFLSYTYSLSENTINLDVCYWMNPIQTQPNTIDRNFFVALPTNQDYIVNYNTFTSQSPEFCDNPIPGPTASHILELGLSLDDFDKSDLILTPNPTTGMVKLISESTINTISIYNTIGVLIKRITDNRDIFFNLSELQNGIYIVEIESNGKKKTQKNHT